MDYKKYYDELQIPSKYPQVVKSLRGNRKLHPFAERVLTQRIDEFLEVKNFKVIAEKYGISNGRIDLSLYHQPRSVIHFEIIASNSGGHVFRDTTSLLISEADTKLAILIDKEIDNSISENYFKAIPKSQVASIFLRTLLLESEKMALQSIINQLITEAEFFNGSTDPSKFYCKLNRYSASCYESIELEMFNTASHEHAVCQIRTKDEVIPLGACTVKSSNQKLNLKIPFSRSLRTKGLHRIEVRLTNGDKWASTFHIENDTPQPILRIDEPSLKIGSEYSFRVENFPSKVELSCYIWQDNSGRCCNLNHEPTTNNLGSAQGTFTVPQRVGAEFLKTGKHRIEVALKDSNIAKAHTFVFINELPGTGALTIDDVNQGHSNGLISLQLKSLTISKQKVSFGLEIMKTTEKEGLYLHELHASLCGLILIGEYTVLYEPELQFAEPIALNKIFRVRHGQYCLTQKDNLLKLTAIFYLNGHPISMDINHIMSHDEVDFILG